MELGKALEFTHRKPGVLKTSEKIVLLYLMHLSEGSGSVKISADKLAQITQTSQRSIQRGIHRLQTKGIINIQNTKTPTGTMGRNIYTINYGLG